MTGRVVVRTTRHVLPPSDVTEIVPCSRQCQALSAQPSQPVPRMPCIRSRNATAFGTRAERGSEVGPRARVCAAAASARRAIAATTVATLILTAEEYASRGGR
jgi:hypothetical protein